MASIELQKCWLATKAILRRAQQALPRNHHSTYASKDEEVNECITHNELGCALEILADIGDLVPCRGRFWRDLERAALVMQLDERAEYYRARFLATKT